MRIADKIKLKKKKKKSHLKTYCDKMRSRDVIKISYKK